MKDNPGPSRLDAQEIPVLDQRAASAEIDRQIFVLKDLLDKIHQRNPLGLDGPVRAGHASTGQSHGDPSAPVADSAHDVGSPSDFLVDERWTLREPAHRRSPSDADLKGPPRVSVDELWKLDDWAQAEEIARHFSALLALPGVSTSTAAAPSPGRNEVDPR